MSLVIFDQFHRHVYHKAAKQAAKHFDNWGSWSGKKILTIGSYNINFV